MASSAVLPMLYEFLVSESRYEARGSEYRARLKAVYDEMMSAQLSFPSFRTGCERQSNFKVLEELVNSVGFADCGDVRTYGLDACPGIRQYVYPAIPDFGRLNAQYVKTWHHFFGLLDAKDRHGTGGRRRPKPAERECESSADSDGYSEDSSWESDSSGGGEHLDAVITADDILCPRVRPDCLSGAQLPIVAEPGPAGCGTAGPGSTGSGSEKDKPAHPQWHNRLPLYMDSTYKIDHGAVVFGLMSDAQLSHEWSCNSSYSSYESTMSEFTRGSPPKVPSKKSGRRVTFADLEAAKSSPVSPTSAVPEESSGLFDPRAIFGNYYCPVPAGHQPTLKAPAPADPPVDSGAKTSITYSNFTSHGMEVTSRMYVGPDGAPHVSCVGTLGQRDCEPHFPSRIKYEDRQLNVQNRLEHALSSMFAIKNAISAQCTQCSGWSVNNGSSMVFCECCEDRMLHEFDPVVVSRLFELRRYLMSELYPAIGYKFVNATALQSAKGDQCTTHVTIPALCGAGGIYPKASLHDGRYVPNSMDIPSDALFDLSSIVFTNAELGSYSECNSRVLAMCRQRREQRLRAFNDYLERLCKLYQTCVSHERYPVIVNEYNQVFKQGLLPFPSAGLDKKRQFFDDVTSYVLYKLPLDPLMLRMTFYRSGIYAQRTGGPRASSLLSLAEEEGYDMRSGTQPPVYQWHEVALKSCIRKAPPSDSASKQAAARNTPSRLKPGSYMDFVTRAGTLDRLPRECVEQLHSTGRLEVGFPTSLEMHLLGIPDAVLDPSLYSKCGMSFLYSLPSLIQNLCALSAFMKVSEASNGRPKRRSKDSGSGKSSQ